MRDEKAELMERIKATKFMVMFAQDDESRDFYERRLRILDLSLIDILKRERLLDSDISFDFQQRFGAQYAR